MMDVKWANKNDRLRGTIVFVEFFSVIFIFGPCIIYLLRNYPYNMTEKRLCQQLYRQLLGKKDYIIPGCG
jgi:hypothetical protein